jgi:hypothetical protein
MRDIIRDSTVGQLINGLSGGRYLPYADQRPNYTIPAHFLLSVSDHIHEKNKVGPEGLAFDPCLVGWNGDDDPENPRCVLHTLFLIYFPRVSEFSGGLLAIGLLGNVSS